GGFLRRGRAAPGRPPHGDGAGCRAVGSLRARARRLSGRRDRTFRGPLGRRGRRCGPATAGLSGDRSARALARVRREAGLRGPAHVRALPYTQDPAELEGVDAAIVGAPTDDLVSDRPGARFGPRAIRAASCPPGPHLEAKVDAMAELRMVDYGDAPVLPADAARTHEAIERTVGEVVA